MNQARPLVVLLLLLIASTAWADDHQAAKAACQDFALRELKSPATARFEPVAEAAAQLSTDKRWKGKPNVWDSISWVDSQNSYGAMLRSDFSCVIQKNIDGTWVLLDIYWFKNRLK
ncbi:MULTISPECIES: hypothetical protein [unclassified Duganella]|uniref:hypothetical protein n=1 Tax=unclassified Duganella TaxID=2636909 RepID=UPI000B7F8939|nr:MULTISPECIES: hypothetical protein [unclassified Duganella]